MKKIVALMLVSLFFLGLAFARVSKAEDFNPSITYISKPVDVGGLFRVGAISSDNNFIYIANYNFSRFEDKVRNNRTSIRKGFAMKDNKNDD